MIYFVAATMFMVAALLLSLGDVPAVYIRWVVVGLCVAMAGLSLEHADARRK